MGKPMMLDPLRCGDCGAGTMELYNRKAPDASRAGGGGNYEVDGAIVVRCTGCHSETVIDVRARLTLKESTGGRGGNLCGGWGSYPAAEGDAPGAQYVTRVKQVLQRMEPARKDELLLRLATLLYPDGEADADISGGDLVEALGELLAAFHPGMIAAEAQRC